MFLIGCTALLDIFVYWRTTSALLLLSSSSLLFCVQEGSPFIVCMTYAFQTTDKLCFILDLMNGGDLHYHLSQHGTFFENEIRFYACEVILGLDHMHTRGIVYRDLKVTGYASLLS